MRKKKHSRRKFLNFQFGSESVIKGSSGSLISNSPSQKSPDKTLLLTADGQLVEVSKSLAAVKKPAKKTTNKELLEWMHKSKNER